MRSYTPNSSQLSRLLLAFVIVTSSVGIFAGAATAQSDQPEWGVELFNEMEGWVSTYNENVDPDEFGFAASQLKNERVNLVVTDANGETATASFRTDGNLRMQELSMGTRDDATLRMSTDKATMDRILQSDIPVSDFINAIRDDEIRISGIGVVPTIKWSIVNLAVDLYRMFA